jgi:crotonobetainyl-CoA:carnitine CoA-transferase CaiB-like acyl-CoA transferase
MGQKELPLSGIRVLDIATFIADIFADPHFRARGNLVEVDVPGVGPVVVPAVIPRLSETPGEITHLGPPLGDATEEVLGGLLGLDPDEIARLRRAGVV